MKSRRQDVLDALDKLGSGTVREIAEHIGCTRATARRHLNALWGEHKVLIWRETFRGRRKWWVCVYGAHCKMEEEKR